MKRCHRCGREWEGGKRQPAVKDFCEGCSAYLHCCLNCRFYDKSAHNQCYIPNTEWVGDKEGANFCDEFEFADADAVGPDGTQQGKAKSKLDALFGEKSDASEDRAPSDFDKLFGD